MPDLKVLISMKSVLIKPTIKIKALVLRNLTLQPMGDPFLNFKEMLELFVLTILHLFRLIISKADRDVINDCKLYVLNLNCKSTFDNTGNLDTFLYANLFKRS